MMNSTVRFAAALALLAPLTVAADALPDRIKRVENGLVAGTVIKGRPLLKASIEKRMADLHVPGVSVAVINNGAIEWARGYGVTEAGGKRAVSPETLFQAASISKPVFALAALHLVEAGKLSLDEDVNRKLKTWQLPAGAQRADAPVTLRNLLNHSAGTTVHGFRGYAQGEAVPTLVQLLDGVKPANSDPVRVETRPGEKWDYSGGGTSIAQLLATSVYGKAFAPMMNDIVLGPLGMKRSTFAQPLPAALHGAAASGHDRQGKTIKGKWHTYPEQAAAGLWTTPSDLARFAIGLQHASSGKSNAIISQAMATQMLTRLKGNYGLGIAVDEVEGVPSFNHGGSNEGFQTVLYALSKGGQGAVVMTNGDSGGVLVREILRSLSAEYQWKEWRVDEKPVVAVDAATLKQYAGEFKLGDMTFKVTLQGERLFIAGPPLGDKPVELYASGQSEFFNLYDGMGFGFEAGQGGKFDMIIRANPPHKAARVL